MMFVFQQRNNRYNIKNSYIVGFFSDEVKIQKINSKTACHEKLFVRTYFYSCEGHSITMC